MGLWNRRGEADALVAPAAGGPTSDTLVATMERLEQGWFWATDGEGCVTYLSEHVAADLGGEAAGLIGQPFVRLLQVDEHGTREGRNLTLLMSRHSRFENLTVHAALSASPRWWSIAGVPRHDGAGNFLGFCGTGLNITEHRQSIERASQLAFYDPLTGLPNRLQLNETLAADLRAAEYRGRPLSAMLLDLDRFKQVNDTLGHQVGDFLLQQVADRLRRFVNDNRAFRLGGDEFLLIVDESDPERLGEMASDIVAALSQPYSIAAVRCVIGASVGIGIAPKDGRTADELVRGADLALYAAKHDGRGCFRFFTPDLLEAAEDRRLIESDLRDALARGELEVAYQPYVEADGHCMKGVEALLRWRHPTRGYVSPAVFVPIAEDADLIGPLGAWVLRQACADAAQWPASTRVSVNVSPLQFADENLPSLVVSALASAGLPPDRLELEVTEGVFIEDSVHAETMFARLKSLGVRLALDDFGTGYSSLGYLRTAPFDKIKIDQSFVRSATLPGSRDRDIVVAIVSLAEAVGMETTVEGVESLDVLDLMRELRATYIQGFIFSKAVSAAELTRRLEAGEWRIDPAGPAKQRSVRHSIYRSVGVLYGNDYLPGVMRNQSATGALIEAPIDMAVGAMMLVDLGQRQLAMARVARASGRRYGVEFEDPLVDDGQGGLRTRRRVPHPLMRQAGLPAVAPQQGIAGMRLNPDQLRGLLGLPQPAATRDDLGVVIAKPADAAREHAGGSVADLAARYLGTLAGDPHRRDQDRAYIRDHLAPSLGRMAAGQLSAAKVDGWLGTLHGADVPARVVDRLRFIASQLLTMAVFGGAETPPAAASTLFDRRDLVERILDLDEARRLGAAARASANPHLRLVLCLLLLTGLRLRELLRLRWEELDIDACAFTLAARRMTMSPAVAALLAAVPRGDGAQWVLPNPQTGKPYRSLGESWAGTLRRAGLADVELEDLRHGVRGADGQAPDETIVALFGLARDASLDQAA